MRLSWRPPEQALSEQQKKQAIAAYHAMVTMVDSYVGMLLDALERLELDESTIVVFTSDHGFQLNEHGRLAQNRRYWKLRNCFVAGRFQRHLLAPAIHIARNAAAALAQYGQVALGIRMTRGAQIYLTHSRGR